VGAVDGAHAALADLGFDAVVAEHGAAFEVGERGAGEDAFDGAFEGFGGDGEEAFDLVAEGGVAGAGGVEVGGALGGGEVGGLVEEGFDAGPAFGGHGRCGGPGGAVNSDLSQARAMAQSRLTVRSEMERAAAVSSTERPPK